MKAIEKLYSRRKAKLSSVAPSEKYTLHRIAISEVAACEKVLEIVHLSKQRSRRRCPRTKYYRDSSRLAKGYTPP